MGISVKWLKLLVGSRKVEQQHQHHMEDANVGVGHVRAGFLLVIMRFLAVS